LLLNILMSNNKNKRVNTRRKHRKKELLEYNKLEILYKESRLDPDTMSGQSNLPSSELVSLNSVVPKTGIWLLCDKFMSLLS
jgi:hypothetical protein